jgi:hypothetical protein
MLVGRRAEPPVIDLVIVVLTLVTYAAAAGFVRLCDRI